MLWVVFMWQVGTDNIPSFVIIARPLDGRIVVLVWAPRGEAHRINQISMRYANEREIAKYARF